MGTQKGTIIFDSHPYGTEIMANLIPQGMPPPPFLMCNCSIRGPETLF